MMERRRSPRFVPERDVYVRLKSSTPVRIVDVSATGMRVESSSALPPAGECDIWLPGEDGDVRMRIRVQRCRARFVKGQGGSGGGLIYQAGIEFLEVDAAARSALGNIVQTLGGARKGGGSAAGKASSREPAAAATKMYKAG